MFALGLPLTFLYTFNFGPVRRAHADLPTIKVDNGRYKDCGTSYSVIMEPFSELPVIQMYQFSGINSTFCMLLKNR